MIKDYLRFFYNRIKWRNKCSFSSGSNVSLDSVFEGANKIGNQTHFDGRLGFCSYISSGCDICSTSIGRFSSIASRVVVNPGSHPFSYPFVSTSPVFYSLRKQAGIVFADQNYFEEIKYASAPYSVVIGHDCWICEGVMIAGGVTIGNGAVVLPHSVVIKDVPPYAVVGGTPAEIKKFRYSSEDIDMLMHFEWWNRPVEWLKANSHLLRDIDQLKEYISKES